MHRVRILLDAVGIRGHGGASLLSELLASCAPAHPEWDWHVFLLARRAREFDVCTENKNIRTYEVGYADSPLLRLGWLNSDLANRSKELGIDVVFSFANLAPIHQKKPHVIYCHQPNAFFELGNRRRSLPEKWRMRVTRTLTLAGARHSRAIIVQTEAMKAGVLSLNPACDGKVHVIPGGFSKQSCEPGCFYGRVPAIPASNGPNLIYVAHPSEHKNHETLIRAMVHVVAEFPSARLLLTLDPNRMDNRRYASLVAQLKGLVEKLSLSEAVLFIGILTPRQVACALRHSDLSVFPSLSESFGLPLVESLAASCPLAASDLPFAHEIAGDAGEYFDPLCERSITRVILRILRSEGLRRELASAAQSRSHMFSYDSIATRVCNVIEHCRAAG